MDTIRTNLTIQGKRGGTANHFEGTKTYIKKKTYHHKDPFSPEGEDIHQVFW